MPFKYVGIANWCHLPLSLSTWGPFMTMMLIHFSNFTSFALALLVMLGAAESRYIGSALTSVPQQDTFLFESNGSSSRLSHPPNVEPDTTVVLLNWARLPNVILQISVYCSPQLEDIVEHVLVWNNKPSIHLKYEKHFINSNCPEEKLVIHNSPDNVYFQARFLGCSLSSALFCFLQDDDYLTRPETFRNIHASFSRAYALNSYPRPIILQPPHDHLESDLLSINIPSGDSLLSTSFACLGHGTFLLRSHAEEFMSLLHNLALAPEESKIAGNYFTILSGYPPNKWLTHSIELLDEEATPFTSGIEGESRNWFHINRAMFYLNQSLNTYSDWPPILPSLKAQPEWTSIAPCVVDPCVIKTNIQVVPDYAISPHVWKQDNMRTLQAERFKVLGPDGVSWYTGHPLSHAVDGDPETSFRSFGSGKKNDKLSLSLFGIGEFNEGQKEVVFLVDVSTASILHASNVETSADEISWQTLSEQELTCFSTLSYSSPQNVFPPSVLGNLSPLNFASGNLLECHFVITPVTSLQGIRITASSDKTANWNLYEVWIRDGIQV